MFYWNNEGHPRDTQEGYSGIRRNAGSNDKGRLGEISRTLSKCLRLILKWRDRGPPHPNSTIQRMSSIDLKQNIGVYPCLFEMVEPHQTTPRAAHRHQSTQPLP